MAMSDTTGGSGVSTEQVSIAAIRPVLGSLILAHTFLTLLVPIFFALFFYSTPHSRRQPIFILNVLTLLLAFSLGVILDTAGIYTILLPQVVLPPAMFIASGAIGIFQSMLVDVILLMRLVVVYPLCQVGPRRFMLITSLPIFLKVVRLANVVIFLKSMTDILDNPNRSANAFESYYASPNLKIEWVAQIVDNAYASIMFLRSIRNKGAARDNIRDSLITVQSTLAYRLRALFRIALSNFVIPTMFSIVLLIISFHDITGDYVGDIVYVNNMLSACGVIFASVWVGMEGRRKWKDRRQSLISEHCNINRSTNTLGVGTRHSAIDPTSPLSVGVVVDPQSDGLNVLKRDVSSVDLEASHELAAVPYAKQEG